MSEEQKQHLEFIQNTITRMNTNSFQIKEWCITIVAALLALYAANDKLLFLIIGFFPTILFWSLDSYYLQQERKFRGIYNNVIGLENTVEIKLYEMPIQKFNGGKYCFWNSFFSKTIIRFYLIIILSLVILTLGISFKGIQNQVHQDSANTETVINNAGGNINE